MNDYLEVRQKLVDAMAAVEPDGPEWIKIGAAIDALDQARVAQINRDFILGARRLDDAIAKLKAVTANAQDGANRPWLATIDQVIRQLKPVADKVQVLLSGEPASALPGMPENNKASFPSAAEPIVRPLREFSRDIAQPLAPAAAGQSAVDAMVSDILQREGGFVDHPNDRGGPTNFGVTQATLANWRGLPVSRDDVRKLSLEEARSIYTRNYYVKPRIAELPDALQPPVFDMSINHGPGTAIKLLQQVLASMAPPCGVDGGIGKETLQSARRAVDAAGAKAVVNALVDRRVQLFKDIAARDPSQKVFLKGWLKRAESFRQT